MSDTKCIETIAQINLQIEECRALEAAFLNDKTILHAKGDLEIAESSLAAAEVEDETIEPEDLIDRRIGARREVEIAKIRLERAQKVHQIQAAQVNGPLIKAAKIAAIALRDAADPYTQRLESGFRKLIGDRTYEDNKPQFTTLIYRKGQSIYGLARTLEAAASMTQTVPSYIGLLTKAIDVLKELNQLD